MVKTHYIEANKQTFKLGENAKMVFIPINKSNKNEKVILDLQHEKKMHLIMVSEDLSQFYHLHPKMNSEENYEIQIIGKNKIIEEGGNEIFIDKAGKYEVFLDYKPFGSHAQWDRIPIEIRGEKEEQQILNKPVENKEFIDSHFTFKLNLNGAFTTGKMLHIQGMLYKNNQIIDPGSLEEYLGAKAHVVLIGYKNKSYVHVHPDVENKAFDLHTSFEEPGWYKMWVQFYLDGKLRTASFVLNVVKGDQGNDSENHDHKHHSHNH